MRKAIRLSLCVAAVIVPVFAACSSQQQPAQQPVSQPYGTYPTTGYPQQPGYYPTAQPYPQGTYAQPVPATATPTQTATPTTTVAPFPFPIPSNLPALIPSGLIPGFPTPAST